VIAQTQGYADLDGPIAEGKQNVDGTTLFQLAPASLTVVSGNLVPECSTP
jgi:hypothetical protein